MERTGHRIIIYFAGGMTYSENPFDLDRYARLKKISANILADFMQTPLNEVREELQKISGYLTPKVDVRAVLINQTKILLVKERDNNKWSLPGGWADVGLSPAENVVTEVKEESGINVRAKRLLAIWDKKFHEHPPDINYTYKIIFQCEVISGSLSQGLETSDVRFFNPAELAELSVNRNTKRQILDAIALCQSG